MINRLLFSNNNGYKSSFLHSFENSELSYIAATFYESEAEKNLYPFSVLWPS